MIQNRHVTKISMAVCVVALALSSCERHSIEPGPPPTLEELIAQTPRENREAEEMALWLSDDLVAPEGLYLKLLGKLELLRKQWNEDYPHVDSIEFIFPQVPSSLLMTLTVDGVEKLRAGTLYQLDSLNRIFRLVTLDSVIRILPDSTQMFNWLTLTFKGALNPSKLSEYYVTVPGIEAVSPNGYGGDWSNIYPVVVGGRVNFLLRRAWGGCPVGCMSSEFVYFLDEGDKYSVMGDCIDEETGRQCWWEEVLPTYERYRYGLP